MANTYFTMLSSSILSGNYALTDITTRINTLYAGGCISDSERDTLLNRAIAELNPENERGDIQEQLEYLGSLITALTERVEALENGASTAQADYPEWEQPIAGLTTNYQQGAIVSHNGTLWISTYAGQNVWEPGVTGTGSLWTETEE